LFFTFQWNNFLHQIVAQIMSAALRSRDDDLRMSLLVKTRLLDRIVDAEQGNQADILKPKGVRRGYMGYLTQIAAAAVEGIESSEVSVGFAKTHPAWNTYVTNNLNPLRVLEAKPLGGHRPTSFMTNVDEDTDEEDEDYEDEEDNELDFSAGFPEFSVDEEVDNDNDVVFDTEEEFNPRGFDTPETDDAMDEDDNDNEHKENHRPDTSGQGGNKPPDSNGDSMDEDAKLSTQLTGNQQTTNTHEPHDEVLALQEATQDKTSILVPAQSHIENYDAEFFKETQVASLHLDNSPDKPTFEDKKTPTKPSHESENGKMLENNEKDFISETLNVVTNHEVQ